MDWSISHLQEFDELLPVSGPLETNCDQNGWFVRIFTIDCIKSYKCVVQNKCLESHLWLEREWVKKAATRQKRSDIWSFQLDACSVHRLLSRKSKSALKLPTVPMGGVLLKLMGGFWDFTDSILDLQNHNFWDAAFQYMKGVIILRLLVDPPKQ